MSDRELAEAMQWEAEQHIPFDMADVSMDFRILPSGNPAGGQMDVLPVTVRKAGAADRTSLLTATRLGPVVVDIGAGTMNVNIAANGVGV